MFRCREPAPLRLTSVAPSRPESPDPLRGHEHGFAAPEGEVDPAWGPPAVEQQRELTGAAGPTRTMVGTDPRVARRHRLIYALVAAGVAVLLALVWGLGGFEKRADLLQPTAPGTLIATGPYEFTFTEVTAQQKTDLDSSRYWELSALGTGRTTGDETIAPSYTDTGTFVSKDIRSREVEVPSGLRYGGRRNHFAGDQFTPGLAPVPFEVQFKYRGSYVPDRTLVFVVFRLKFSDTSLIGGQDKVWSSTPKGFDYRLPVRVLPADTP